MGPEGSQVENAGSVNVIFGARKGLRARNNQFWTQDSPGIDNDLGEFDNFGSALAAANLGNGPTADLAVGVARENLPTDHEGLVHLIYGTPEGLKANGSQLWSQDSVGVADNAEIQDFFGVSLVTGDFGKSPLRDLAIGVVGEDERAGAVEILFARDEGLAAAGDQFWSQDSPQIKDVAEPFDNFGVGRFD